MPVLFKNLAKAVNDALNKGFDTVTNIKLTTKSDNGVKYTAEVKAKGSSVSSKVGASFKGGDGLDFKKIEIANNGALTALVNLEDVVDNATFNLDVHLQPLRLNGAGERCLVGVDYSHEKARVSLTMSPVLPTAATISAVIKATDNLAIGGLYSGEFDDSVTTTQAKCGLAYTTEGSTVSMVSGDFLESYTIGAHVQHSKCLAFAARVGLDKTTPSNANVTLGLVHNRNADTTLKAKISVPSGLASSSNLSIGLSKRLSKDVKVNLGSVIGLDNSGGNHTASFGMGVELGA